MDMPKLLYHGTFWVDGIEPDWLHIDPDNYVSTSSKHSVAYYFARVKRWEYKDFEGVITIYTIDTDKFPQDVVSNAIPPDGFHPMAEEDEDIRNIEKELQAERIQMADWRLTCVPSIAIINKETKHEEPDPDMASPLMPIEYL